MRVQLDLYEVLCNKQYMVWYTTLIYDCWQRIIDVVRGNWKDQKDLSLGVYFGNKVRSSIGCLF